MSSHAFSRRLRSVVPPVAFAAGLLVVWQLSVTVFAVRSFILPAPRDVLGKLVSNGPMILHHASLTAAEAALGFALAVAGAFITAVVLAHAPRLRASIYPYIIALKTVPIVAVVPLLVLWFGNGIWSKAAMAALISYFPIVVNLLRGLLAIPSEWLDLFASLSASRWATFSKLRLPSSLPYFFSALKISATLSVIGALVAEMAGSDSGVGYLILAASYRIETDMVFASIIVAAAIGIIFYYALNWLERLVVYWQEPEHVV